MNKSAIGVIRLDLYREDGSFKKDFLRCLSHDGRDHTTPFFVNELATLLLNQNKRQVEENSYRCLYRGTNLLKSLQALSKARGRGLPRDEREILEMTTHLFYVFQRHTYIGHEEIMKRVLYYTDDIAGALSLSLPFAGLLEQFKDQEKLMLYDIEKYRDHFMHQFHVFILGYITINWIGIDSIIATINKRRSRITGYHSDNCALDRKGLLRTWMLIAFFHDICYLFQEYKIGIENFIKQVMRKDVTVSFDWSRTVFEQDESKDGFSYSDRLEKLCKYFVAAGNQTNSYKLLTNYYEAILRHQDHGIISALYMLEYLMSPDKHPTLQREHESYTAALAISMHNSNVFDGLGEGDEISLSFESFPLEFLLVYCDALAEWGREKRSNGSLLKGPMLERFSYDERVKKFMGTLNYDETPHISREFVNDKVAIIRNVFKSEEFKFTMHYRFAGAEDLLESLEG